MPILRVCNISQSFGKKLILNGLSLEAKSGTIVALLGPNGAGKTTLLKTIIGLNKPPRADLECQKNIIMLDDQVINTWPISKKVQYGLVYLPQHTSLFAHMSVQENLELVYEYQPYWLNKPHHEFITERNNWLAQTTLSHALSQTAGVLSGGQKRKLEVVRSLLMHPTIIILDEPFAGVDPKSIYELKEIFQRLATCGIGIIISDHHVDQLLSIATSVYVVLQGKVVTSGSIKDILENKDTKDSYLGDQFYAEISHRFL